jgi:RND superfamily putative drug exporter
VLERWTHSVLRFRVLVLALWLCVLVAGADSYAHLDKLLSTNFTVPGSESERARLLLKQHFGEQPEGTFVVVFEVPRSSEALERELSRRLARAARLVPSGKARDLEDGDGILYGEIDTRLNVTRAKGYTDALRKSLGSTGPPRAYVTGQPAIQHDVEPALREDLRRAELVAVPIALAILVAVLGLSLAVVIPLIFAACTITATLGIVYLIASAKPMATYVPALVQLIGLGLAIDYSLLVVHRYREEAARGASVEQAVIRTMSTAGRAVVFSGFAVAIGLALLLLVPVPFLRSMGVGGLLIPLVSILAVLTLQPVLLSLLGHRGMHGLRELRTGIAPPLTRGETGFWIRLANTITRRPVAWLTAGTALLVAASLPILSFQLTPGSISGLPDSPEAMRGFARLSEGVGPGAVTPIQVVVDSGAPGGSVEGPTRDAVDRLADALFEDEEVFVVASGRRPPYVDESRRYTRVVVVGRGEYGSDASRALVSRLRDDFVPDAGFPPNVTVNAGGAPPQGADFLDRAYGALPWVVLAVLSVTYLVLLRAFRSIVLPLKAVVLNLATVTAVCGLLVVWFEWGAGERLFGITEASDIEGWVPIFLFATLFGLSMDYEVFLVSRMREAWDEVPDNRRAIAYGLARSGRVVTAAAAIMIVAFAGFVAGRVVGLQQLGFGLAVGVLLDATLVRMVVLPSLMAVIGRWNWWLPPRIARLARVEPSPLER